MIAQQLLETGILQLGVFVENGKRCPYRLRLEMLPAYPKLFSTVIDTIINQLAEPSFDRLIAPADCVAIAGAIAQKAGISLVYSRNGLLSPVLRFGRGIRRRASSLFTCEYHS
jgi:adenine/guanine phosphoribosyltransferase-like PRPP-binding protein